MMKTNTMALIALILALAFPPAGLILALITLKKIKKEGGEGKVLATTALFISILWFIVTLIATLIAVYVYSTMFNFEGVIPSRCYFNPELECFTPTIDGDEIELHLINLMYNDIMIKDFIVDECSDVRIKTKLEYQPIKAQTIGRNTEFYIQMVCPNIKKRAEKTMLLRYELGRIEYNLDGRLVIIRKN